MAVIQFVVPYASIRDAVIETYKEYPYSKEIEFIITDKGHESIRKEDLVGDVVIARGLTAMELNKRYNNVCTLLELPMTGYDFLMAINTAREKYGAKRIALIATETAIYGFKEFQFKTEGENLTFLEYEITPDSDFNQIVMKARKENADVIICAEQVGRICKSMNVPFVRILSSHNSIWQAIDEAWLICKKNREEKIRNQRLQSVFKNISEGVITVDKNKKVVLCSEYAAELLNIRSESIEGKNIANINPLFDNPPFGKLTSPEVGTLIHINGQDISLCRIPISDGDEFESGTILLQKLSSIQKLETKLRTLAHKKGFVAHYSFDDLVGKSEALMKAKRLAKEYANVSANVLITGQTGTGKEMFAQSIHNASDRRNGPFLAINCASLPESLLESELFGYAPGAFTGASKTGKQGLIELAHNGTFFLDEIAELGFNLQGKLLRIIEEREIRRIGDDTVIPVNIRIISASNKNLEQMVKQGKFRSDLYYRLDVLKLNIPSLVERKADIPELVDCFIAKYDQRYHVAKHYVEDDVYKYLSEIHYWGNIRQLRNICERLCVVVKSSNISLSDLQLCLGNSVYDDNTEAVSDNWGKEELIETLRKYGGNKTKASEALGIDRTTLYRRMRKYEL